MRVCRDNALNRRRFLQAACASVLGAPALVHPAVLGREGYTSPANSIAMGFIGVGDMGRQNLNSFLSHDGVAVVALCDVDRNYLEYARELVARRSGLKCETCTDFRQLLARGGLDAVCIAVPDHWHGVISVAAARAGLDVYGEKPIAYNIAEGRAICDAIRLHGRVWQTGSWQRSQSNFHRACELVRNSRLGKVRRVEVGLTGGFNDHFNRIDRTEIIPPPPELDYDMWLGPAPYEPYCPARLHKNWRWILDYGGGKITDWIGHHGDIALWGLGLEHTGPSRVEATGKFGEGLWNVPIEFLSNCYYDDGLVIVLGSEFDAGTRFIGDKGTLFVTRGVLEADPPSLLKEQIGAEEIRLYESTDHTQNFLDCIRSRRSTVAPAESAHRAATLAHLSNISLRLGRPIQWDAPSETAPGDADANRLLARPMRAPWTC